MRAGWRAAQALAVTQLHHGEHGGELVKVDDAVGVLVDLLDERDSLLRAQQQCERWRRSAGRPAAAACLHAALLHLLEHAGDLLL
jgi:hypothetical protein